MTVALLVLEYVRVLCSGPVVSVIAVLIFLVMFREDVKALMLRVASIRLPGGAEFHASQSAQQEREARAAARPVPDPEPEPQPLNFNGLTAQQREEIENIIRGERANAYLWEYRYLNFFLVYRTQQVLDWLASVPQPVSIQLYSSYWLPSIPSAEERAVIITALAAHSLLQVRGEAVEVTAKGREYLAWRGPLPPLPTASSTS